MKLNLGYIKYELLPDYTEKSQLTDLFTEHKFWGWLGLFTIFILVCLVIYFQIKIWDSEDKLEDKRIQDRRGKEFKE